MQDDYSTLLRRIVDALERIADALEAEATAGNSGDDGEAEGGDYLSRGRGRIIGRGNG